MTDDSALRLLRMDVSVCIYKSALISPVRPSVGAYFRGHGNNNYEPSGRSDDTSICTDVPMQLHHFTYEHSNVLLFLIKIPYVRNRSAEYVGRFAYTLVLIAILTLTVVSKATLLFRCQPALLILILSTACCSWYAYLHTYSGEYIYGSIYTTIL